MHADIFRRFRRIVGRSSEERVKPLFSAHWGGAALSKRVFSTVFKHRWNTCIYKEAQDILKEKVDVPELINPQVEYYRANGYPENNGLYELPVLIRKKSDRNNLINLRWWEQICKFSSRDQVSFPVVMWSLGLKPIILPGNGNGFNQNAIVPHYKV